MMHPSEVVENQQEVMRVDVQPRLHLALFLPLPSVD
jgi:hypothetical protein